MGCTEKRGSFWYVSLGGSGVHREKRVVLVCLTRGQWGAQRKEGRSGRPLCLASGVYIAVGLK